MRKTEPEELVPGALEKYCHDLTALARQGQFAPLQRREQEVERVFQVLARRLKNNPALIGEDSAECFAIVAEVVRRIRTGDVPEMVSVRYGWAHNSEVPVREEMPFREKVKAQRVVALDLEKLLVDVQTRGDFEKLLRSVIVEIKQTPGLLLFVDKFHRLVGAGAAEKVVDMANILVPVLSRGEVQVIGTSNLDDYRKYVERDQALQRRFQEIIVREFSH